MEISTKENKANKKEVQEAKATQRRKTPTNAGAPTDPLGEQKPQETCPGKTSKTQTKAERRRPKTENESHNHNALKTGADL